jgi:L-asparaginase
MKERRKPNLKLIILGGTFIMEQDSNGHLMLSEETINKLTTMLPSTKQWASVGFELYSNIPGEWLAPHFWLEFRSWLAKTLLSPTIDAAVVIVGTDGLEEIGYFLHLTMPTRKPIVLTAAMRSITEIGSDAPLNLLDAIRVASAPGAIGKGVLIVSNSHIYSARDVCKNDTQAIGAIESNLGPLGVVDREGVFFYREPLRRHTFSSEFATDSLNPLPRVDICCAYAGADGALVRSALAAGAAGIVIAALGSGNVNQELGKTLAELASRGIPIVISSQARSGRVSGIYQYPGGGGWLANAGCLFADNLSPLKARVLLMVALQRGLSLHELKRVFLEY